MPQELYDIYNLWGVKCCQGWRSFVAATPLLVTSFVAPLGAIGITESP